MHIPCMGRKDISERVARYFQQPRDAADKDRKNARLVGIVERVRSTEYSVSATLLRRRSL